MKQFIIYVICFFFPVLGNTQVTESLNLELGKLTVSSKCFYIKEIIDNRKDTSFFINKINKKNGQKSKVKLTGGITNYLSKLINVEAQQSNSNLVPIIVHINSLDGTMKTSNNLWSIKLNTVFSFYFEEQNLMELRNGKQIENTKEPNNFINNYISNTLDEYIKQFDSWFLENKGKIVLDTIVKMNVIVGRKPDSLKHIVFMPDVKLTIDDFVGRPDNNSVMKASTFSGMGFWYLSVIEDSRININLSITPYFDKSRSWFKTEGKIPSVLAHEQLHFDICGLQTCLIAKTISQTVITKHNYATLIDQLRLQGLKECNEMQELYDNQTLHGTLPEEQEKWSKKIKEKLNEIDCYK